MGAKRTICLQYKKGRLHKLQYHNAWSRHQMETFSALLALCAGNSSVTGEFPHKGQWGGALMFSLFCAWTNGWVNNIEGGDLRRYRTHYDVTVMGLNSIRKSCMFIAIDHLQQINVPYVYHSNRAWRSINIFCSPILDTSISIKHHAHIHNSFILKQNNMTISVAMAHGTIQTRRLNHNRHHIFRLQVTATVLKYTV